MMSDLTLRLLVLLSAVTKIVFPYFVNPFRGGEHSVRGSVPSQIEPAEYAFAIWGPIYAGAVVYAIWQLTPQGRADPVTRWIAPLAIVLYAGSSLWLWTAKYGPLWATMPILAVMTVCAVTALVVAAGAETNSLQRMLCLVVPFGLYAGWTLCATLVNAAEVAPVYGFDRFGLSVPGYAVLSIVALTIAVAVALWLTHANLVFAGTVVWALAAIIAAARERGADSSVVLAAIAALLVVLALTVRLRVTDARSGA